MSATRVDHVALWVEEPRRYASFFTDRLGMHEIERTDAFTLVGADARRGKLTFFQAQGARTWSPLAGIALHCSPPARGAAASALEARPADADTLECTGPDGMALALLGGRGGEDWDLARVTLGMEQPAEAHRAFVALGFTDNRGRLELGDTELVLAAGGARSARLTRLNHLALLVDCAEAEGERARSLGFEIDRVVDAANTRAVFLWGPERVLIEYVEHKPTFSLT